AANAADADLRPHDPESRSRAGETLGGRGELRLDDDLLEVVGKLDRSNTPARDALVADHGGLPVQAGPVVETDRDPRPGGDELAIEEQCASREGDQRNDPDPREPRCAARERFREVSAHLSVGPPRSTVDRSWRSRAS